MKIEHLVIIFLLLLLAGSWKRQSAIAKDTPPQAVQALAPETFDSVESYISSKYGVQI